MAGSLTRNGPGVCRGRFCRQDLAWRRGRSCLRYRCVLLLSVLGLDIELVSVLMDPLSLGGAMVLSVVTPVEGDVGCDVLVLS
jgi:hypothetical protein